MDPNTLRCIINCDPLLSEQVVGIYSVDKIKKNVLFPSGFIINSDKSSGPGKRWLAMYFKSDFEIEFFDSY